MPANAIDAYVGARVRLRRTLLSMSQEKLGDALGLTFQQVQKYERGANRIGAGRLLQLSRILDIPVSYFFDGYEDGDKALPAARLSEPDAPSFEIEHQQLTRRESLDLIRAFYQIPSARMRRRVIELVRSIAELSAADKDSENDVK